MREIVPDELKEPWHIGPLPSGRAAAARDGAAQGIRLDRLPRQQLGRHPMQRAPAAVVADAAALLLRREQRLPGQLQAALQAGCRAAASMCKRGPITAGMAGRHPCKNRHFHACILTGAGALRAAGRVTASGLDAVPAGKAGQLLLAPWLLP